MREPHYIVGEIFRPWLWEQQIRKHIAYVQSGECDGFQICISQESKFVTSKVRRHTLFKTWLEDSTQEVVTPSHDDERFKMMEKLVKEGLLKFIEKSYIGAGYVNTWEVLMPAHDGGPNVSYREWKLEEEKRARSRDQLKRIRISDGSFGDSGRGVAEVVSALPRSPEDHKG